MKTNRMKTNKLISMILIFTMMVSLFMPFGLSVNATATDIITGCLLYTSRCV